MQWHLNEGRRVRRGSATFQKSACCSVGIAGVGLGKSETHGKLGHEGQESAHEGTELTSKNGSESADEIGSGSEQLGLYLRALDAVLLILIFLSVVNLARRTVAENLFETLAELLDVFM
jgi:hypothetical protein